MYKLLAIFLALISILLLIVLKNQESEYDLVIIVISARDHFFQRNVIRETWKTSAANVSVKTLFAVGKECLIHPSDRIDEFSCRMWNISLEDVDDEMHHSWSYPSSNIPFNSSPGMEFIFNVIHSIEVHELTIQSSCQRELKRGNITITLYDRKTDDSLTSVDLDLNNTSSSFHTNITKIRIPQNSILLPKDFEGVITVEGGKCSSELLERVGCSPFLDCVDSRSDPVVGMNFKILDKNRLRGFIQDRSYRQDAWSLVQKKRSSELQQESSLYKDMLFIDAVDTYRNLPEKLLQSLQWLYMNINVNYIMKTDDDCYVNVPLVVRKLQQMRSANLTQRVWLGNFRKMWAVYDHGKWAEHNYNALTYPWFACGSGYIISSDIGAYLTSAHPHLHRFQGEDVSMGIWLSPLTIRYIDDESFSCVLPEDGVTNSLVSIPELTGDGMKQVHTELTSDL